MNQNARNRTITNMRRGRIRLLVATDVAARGLDVSGISHVINFDLPKLAEDYVHRIGRTGRAGASGVAISFASLNEASYLDRIQRFIGQSLPQHVIPGLEPTRSLPAVGGRNQKRQPGNSKKAPNSAQRQDKAAGGDRKWSTARRNTVIVEYRNQKPGRPDRRVV
jgi:superfamily II DNA/RNA helicase